MSILTPIPPATPLLQRALFRVPVLGWIARDVAFGSHDNIWYALVIFVTAVVLSVATWGLAALVMVALTLVPVMFAFLIVFSKPF